MRILDGSIYLLFLASIFATFTMGKNFSSIMDSSHGFFEYKERQLEASIRIEEANCTDKAWEDCAHWVSINMCGVYRKTLRNRCRKSCSMCGHENCAFTEHGCCWDMRTPAKGPNGSGCPRNCHNRFGLHKCYFLKANGACHKHQDAMQRMCKGACNCDWVQEHPKPECSLSEHGCCLDGITSANQNHTNCPVCKDHFPIRVCKVFSNLCTEHEVMSGWQMRKFCPKTCGICNFFDRNRLKSYLEDLNKEIKLLDYAEKKLEKVE